ncbi:MAG: alpha-E domain-containing protein [Gammaproteobacteria bacterium]
MLLSRVAERVYWQARYIERAENTARLLSVYSALLMDLPAGTKLGWHTLIQITGHEKVFAQRYKQANERNVIKFLLADCNNLSIVDMLAAARENARTTREIMPTEAFELINNLYYTARDNAESGVARGPRHELLEGFVADCQKIWGLLAGTMSRDDAYSFIRLGRSLERADMTTRIVDVGSSNLIPELEGEKRESEVREPYENILWMNVLKSQSAFQMYRQHVQHRVKGVEVVRYLLKDEQFPRSTAHNLTTLTKVLQKLPNNSKVKWQVDQARRLIRESDIDKLLRRGLLKYLDNVQKEIANVHFRIAETWFLSHK